MLRLEANARVLPSIGFVKLSDMVFSSVPSDACVVCLSVCLSVCPSQCTEECIDVGFSSMQWHVVLVCLRRLLIEVADAEHVQDTREKQDM